MIKKSTLILICSIILVIPFIMLIIGAVSSDYNSSVLGNLINSDKWFFCSQSDTNSVIQTRELNCYDLCYYPTTVEITYKNITKFFAAPISQFTVILWCMCIDERKIQLW